MDEFDAWSDATEQLFTERDVESAAEALGLDDQLAKGRDQFTFDRLLPADLAAAVELVTEPFPVDGLSGSVILLDGYSGLNKINNKITNKINNNHKNSMENSLTMLKPRGYMESRCHLHFSNIPRLRIRPDFLFLLRRDRDCGFCMSVPVQHYLLPDDLCRQ